MHAPQSGVLIWMVYSHLSQASVVDLSANLNNASQNGGDSSLLRSLLEKLPIGGGSDEDKVSQADAMQERPTWGISGCAST